LDKEIPLKCLFAFLIALILAISSFHLPAQAAEAIESIQLFEMHCAGCHINGGNIIRRGKTLKQAALKRNGYDSIAAITEIVENGKGNMSAYRDRLSAAQIETIATYVFDQAERGWK
jgi:cytochrome c6